MSENKKSLIASLVVLVIFTILFFYGDHKRDKETERIKQAEIQKKIEAENRIKDQIKTSIESLNTEYGAISVYDTELDQEIYGKNSSVIKPLASLVKTMTVVTALETNTKNYIKIPLEALRETGDYNLVEGEVWNVFDLSKFTLILSSNDGAKALTRGDINFLSRMNTKARNIGMQNTEFLNVTGLDVSKDKAGAYGTALDANRMATYALKAYPEIFESSTWPALRVKSESGYTHDITNTNPIIKNIPGILFSKTGFTELAGGNLTVIFTNAYTHKLAVTILGSTITGRFTDMEKIVNALYNINYGQ